MEARTASFRPYRVEVTGKLGLSSPIHIGTGEAFSLLSDAPVLRLPNERAYLPGSSIRGVLRDHIEREAGLRGCSEDHVNSLFGHINQQENIVQGALGRMTVCDAYPEAERETTEIRDHVRIDPSSGAAEQGAKFDMEALLPEPGRSFRLRLIYEGDGPAEPEYSLFVEAVDFLRGGRARLGAKSAWGFGAIELKEIEVRNHDRATADGLLEYLLYRAGAKSDPSDSLPKPAFSRAAVDSECQPWAYLDMDLDIIFDGPVLIKDSLPPLTGQPAWDPENFDTANDLVPDDGGGYESIADMTFIRSRMDKDNRYYLPGSSLRGVLRHQAQKICRTMFGNCNLVGALFGFVDVKKKTGRKSLIAVANGAIQNPKDARPVFFDHVAIDRIVNCAEDGAKFSTSALVSPVFSTAISMRFHDTARHMAALALWGFVLRDLMEGRLWAGHGTSRGYGYIARAELRGCALSAPTGIRFAPESGWTCSPGKGRFRAERPKSEKRDETLEFTALSWIWEKVDEDWKKLGKFAPGENHD